MGFARIITRLGSGYDAIQRDLCERGFQIETRESDEPDIPPADLEIRIEECTAEEALKRVTDTRVDASVFVAPGALTGGTEPTPAIPL